jgi:hypothetical protein
MALQSCDVQEEAKDVIKNPLVMNIQYIVDDNQKQKKLPFPWGSDATAVCVQCMLNGKPITQQCKSYSVSLPIIIKKCRQHKHTFVIQQKASCLGSFVTQ